MLNKNRLIQLFVMLLILLLLVTWRTVVSLSSSTTATQILGNDVAQNNLVRCDYLTPCEFSNDQGIFWLSVNNPPIKAEQWIHFSLQSKALNWQVLEAKIVGKTMFMGRIPVTFNAITKNEFAAKTLIGACTTKEMIWQLQITVEVNGIQELLAFDFMVRK